MRQFGVTLVPTISTLFFIKNSWDILKGDIINFVKEFHGKAKLSKFITSTFSTLIPKSVNPLVLNDYRPICLVGNLYKILAKF